MKKFLNPADYTWIREENGEIWIQNYLTHDEFYFGPFYTDWWVEKESEWI